MVCVHSVVQICFNIKNNVFFSDQTVKKDLNGTRERVKHALQSEDEPVPHKRRRRTENGEKEQSPPTRYEPEKEKRREDSKSDKPKPRRPAPPPMDFNQLLKLAEQKKSEPLEAVQKKALQESETERLMTKKQKREYEEEMARRQRRQERIDAEAKGGKPKQPRENRSMDKDRPVERERKPESGGFGRIPKLTDKNNSRNDSPKPDRDRERFEKLQREKERAKIDREKNDREKERLERARLDKERLDKLKAERERIDRDIARLNIDRERLDKAKTKLETRTTDKPSKPADNGVDRSKLNSRENVKKNIDLKSQNTYRIDKNSNEKKFAAPNKDSNGKYLNGHSTQGKSVPKSREQIPQKNGVREKEQLKPRASDGRPENGKRLHEKELSKRPDDRKMPQGNPKLQPGSSKPKPTSSFDFDKHINSIGKNGHAANKNGVKRPDGMKKRPQPDDRRKQKRRAVDSDSEYDSELDDFIDDGDEEMDYSKHIKEIFGYDKSKYRDIDDDDDPDMESSFARQQREEYISKKIGIMEDLEDMRMEAMMKKKSKKGRRISDDD
ncbi:hypothetical protein O3G_MSEX008213 [Manduca sexta]|uniref:Protein SPT2 homolog n=1 Tax=Manduca sexta TaxID=7130 RepID=A0A921ZA15_MANSE|nr:hypothetical protein O3G_MSEX008213 [Manduca sexta]